jgi:hypothetical protein
VGRALVGGALAFEDVKPPYLTHLFLVCADQITGLRSIFIGTNEVAFNKTTDYLTPAAILTPLGHLVDGEITSSPNYATRLNSSYRVGTTTQAVDPLLLSQYPSIGSDFRQLGHAAVCMRYHYGTDFDEHQALWGNGGQPNPLFLIDGGAIPDPRNPGNIVQYNTSDPDEVAAAKATWSWTDNASLITAYYLSQPWGGNISPTRMDWDRIADAANYDDEVVGTQSGVPIKRHTINGLISLDQNPASVLQGMMASNRSFLIDSGKSVWITSARPRDPIATIYDDILVGGLEYRAAKPKRDLVNKVKSRFIANDREYNLVDGPTLERADLIAEDGELLESSPLDLPFVDDHRRVERLQKAYLETARLGKTLVCHVDLVFLTQTSDEIIGAVVVFDSNLFPECNGIYVITQVAFSDNFSMLDISMVEYDKTIETNWDYAVDEQDFTLPPVDLS